MSVTRIHSQTCYSCEKAMPAGADVCPHCGKSQRLRPNQPRIILAIVLAIVLFAIWNWLRG